MTNATALWLMEWKPSLYARVRLEFFPDAYQTEFLDNQSQESILNWCRQSGKTISAAILVGHRARYKPKSLSLIISATQRQAGILQKRVQGSILGASRHGWRYVKGMELPADPLDENSKMVRCSVLSMELGNGSEVVSVPSSPDTVRGYSPDLLVLDEAARIPDLVYDAIRPMMAAHPCKMVAMSTPAGRRGWYYREWTTNTPGWYRSMIPADKCPRITAEFLKRERGIMSSDAMYRQEYECEFVEMEGSLFNREDLDDMHSEGDSMILRPTTGGGERWQKELIVDGGVLK